MSEAAGLVHREVRASESRIEFALSGVFSLLLGGTLAYVHSLFEPLVPTARLWTWTGSMALVAGLMMILPLLFIWRRPDAREIERIWSPLGKLVAILYDLAVAASVWILLPYASEPLQLLMVIFYCAAISGQVIATAESIGTITFGVVAVFGSAALFFVNSETIYASSLAIFLLAFGGMMVSTALVLKHAIRSAVTQGLRAEAISQDLARALAETQAERDSRTRFIAAASHDLRQPLQAASLFFAQLQRSDDPERRERARRGVERGLAEAMVMLEAMSEHLRLESGSLEAHCQPVDLAAIFASLALELGPAAQRAGIDLRASRPRVSVLADPVLLTRILRNLLTNALLHSRGRHVRLLARRRALVEIIVIDDGVGISPEEAETLFLPYTQGAGAHRLGHGSGLGLAIAREMAHLMDARLVLEPRWRGGCAFVLALPAASPPQAGPEDRATPPADAPLAARTILLVEDRADIREAIAASLSRRGIKVAQFATSDAVAAALAEGLRPSAVITDWHLGAEDSGVRVVALVREHAPGAGIVVISGDATATATSEIARSGCRLLLKPVSETDLLEALRAVSSVPG